MYFQFGVIKPYIEIIYYCYVYPLRLLFLSLNTYFHCAPLLTHSNIKRTYVALTRIVNSFKPLSLHAIDRFVLVIKIKKNMSNKIQKGWLDLFKQRFDNYPGSYKVYEKFVTRIVANLLHCPS